MREAIVFSIGIVLGPAGVSQAVAQQAPAGATQAGTGDDSRRSGLRIRAGAGQEEDYDLLVGLRPGVDAAMDARLRPIPVDHPGRDRYALLVTIVPELDAEQIAADDHRHPMADVRVPGHRLARLEDEPADEEIVTSSDDFGAHGCWAG